MNVAIITAGGVGNRMESKIPKQFLKVLDKPLIVYTIEKFQENNSIDAICIACLEGYEDYFLNLKKKYQLTKIKWLCKNGNSQPGSIYNCIKTLENEITDDSIIIIHAGNRPLISKKIIDNSIYECINNGNAVTYIPCPEVIVKKSTNEIIERTDVMRIQTPQTFFLKDLVKCYSNFLDKKYSNVSTTCDFMLRLGYKINFIDGEVCNFKITYPDDLKIFESIIKKQR